jgi:hypothetical protein
VLLLLLALLPMHGEVLRRTARSRAHRWAGEVPYRMWLPQCEIVEALLRCGRLRERAR